jgi:hypothetical protein
LFTYVAGVVAVVGVPAAHPWNSPFGRIGVIGAVTSMVGYVMVVTVRVISLVPAADNLMVIRIAGAGLVLIGSALLGNRHPARPLLPWWCGVLLIVAFPPGDVANEVFPVAENLLLALLWGAVGVALRGELKPSSPWLTAMDGGTDPLPR